MTEARTYIRDGAEIYRRSFAIIRAEADLARFKGHEEKVAVRIIHASGMVEIARDIVMSPDFAGAARAAWTAARRSSATRRWWRTASRGAGSRPRTRSSARSAMRLFRRWRTSSARRDRRRRWSCGAISSQGAVIAIGNAPTSLFHLLEMLDRGAPKPAAVIGLPVGFVGAAESKEALAADGRVPFLIVRGRKGGSAMAVAAVNALASDVE